MNESRFKFQPLKLGRKVQLNRRTRFFALSYLIELLVVMIGVTAGFALNNWAEARKDQQMAKEYLETLRSDLENDMRNLRSCDSINERKIGEMTQLLVLLVTNNREEQETINQLVRISVEDIPFFHPSKTALRAFGRRGRYASLKTWHSKMT